MTEERDDYQPRQLVFDVRERVHETRAAVRQDMLQGGVSATTQQEFASTLLVYYDVLKEHRGEAILDPGWGERGVDWLDDASRQTVTRTQSKPGLLHGTETVRESLLSRCDIDRLMDTADALDQIAKELGFTAETPDHTPGNEWDKADLLALMSCREQDVLVEVYDALDIDLNGGENDGNDNDSPGEQAAGD